MPYNSSAFEKQLARYKAAQAGKAAAENTPHDPQRVRARTSMDYGQVKSSTIGVSQLVGDGPQTTPVLRSDQLKDGALSQTVIVIENKKKPIWLRGWFIFLMTTVLSTAAMPVFFKGEMEQMIGLMASVKSSTGVDPLSINTYTSMVKGGLTQTPAPTTDIHATVEQARQRAEEVTSQGGAASMEYIQSETQRLNDMARQLNEQYNGSAK